MNCQTNINYRKTRAELADVDEMVADKKGYSNAKLKDVKWAINLKLLNGNHELRFDKIARKVAKALGKKFDASVAEMDALYLRNKVQSKDNMVRFTSNSHFKVDFFAFCTQSRSMYWSMLIPKARADVCIIALLC